MILDASLVFSDAQAVTATAASDNYVDQLAAGNAYVGPWVIFRVDTVFSAGGSPTLTIDIETDDNTSFSSPTVLLTLGTTVAKTTLVAGYSLKKRLPTGSERYLRAKYTVASGPFEGGKADVFMAKDADLVLA